VADRERVIEATVDRIEAQTRQRAAADARDTELISQINLELRSIDREALAGLSPQLAQYLVTSDGGVAAAALFADLEGEEVTAVRAVIVEIDPPQSYIDGHAQLLAYLDEPPLLTQRSLKRLKAAMWSRSRQRTSS
jgi:hypothetical protein